MPILIDSRTGSKDLLPYFDDGILTELKFGDVAFVGNGPEGNVEIGVEIKRIADLVQSIANGRLAGHQVPGLVGTYYKVYLIVEGVWRPNPQTGVIQIYKGNWFDMKTGREFTFAGVWGFLNTLAVQAGIIVLPTTSIRSTVLAIQVMSKWWQEKWERHHSLQVLYKPTPPRLFTPARRPGHIHLRYIAAELPGIGWERALAVEKKFRTVQQMMDATEEEWREVEGIGKVTAQMVWRALREE